MLFWCLSRIHYLYSTGRAVALIRTASFPAKSHLLPGPCTRRGPRAAFVMLTGSVVGDGNYEALNSLFAAAAGHTLTFEGSLAQEGSPTIAVVYTIKQPTMPRPPAVSAGMDAVSEARASLGWATELLDCCECSCSIADYGLQAEQMVGAIDVGEGGLLRVLMLSSSRPELGRVVCLLDPRRSPPSLEGGDEDAFLAGGVPRIRTELRPTQIAPPPRAQDPGAAASAATAAERTGAPLDMAPLVASVPAAEQRAAVAPGDKKARLAHLAAPPKPAPTAKAPTAPLLAVFSGHLHHPMFGELEASLSLSEKLDAEPPQAVAGRSATRAKWPPPPAEDDEGLPAPSTSWWRGVWRVTEFKGGDEVFVGVHGSAGAPTAAMLLVTPSRSGPPCDLAQYERDIADASSGRFQGGDDAWAAGMRPEYTLTKRSGGARVF